MSYISTLSELLLLKKANTKKLNHFSGFGPKSYAAIISNLSIENVHCTLFLNADVNFLLTRILLFIGSLHVGV